MTKTARDRQNRPRAIFFFLIIMMIIIIMIHEVTLVYYPDIHSLDSRHLKLHYIIIIIGIYLSHTLLIKDYLN